LRKAGVVPSKLILINGFNAQDIRLKDTTAIVSIKTTDIFDVENKLSVVQLESFSCGSGPSSKHGGKKDNLVSRARRRTESRSETFLHLPCQKKM
jgi:hypothetical protein